MKKNLLFLFVAIAALTFTSCKDDNKTPDSKELKSLSISPASLSMVKNQSVRFEAVTDPEGWNGSEFVWTSSDESVFTVDQNGNVTAQDVEAGTATITVDAGGKTASATVRIQDELDTYQFNFYPAGFNGTKVNDTTKLYEYIAFTEDAFLDSEGYIDGEGAFVKVPFMTYGDDQYYYPWQYLGKNSDGTRNLNMTSVDYDTWEAAIAAGDPTSLYGKIKGGKFLPDVMMDFQETYMRGETPSSEQFKFVKGARLADIRGKAKSFLIGSMTSIRLYLDTLVYTTPFVRDGKKLEGYITEYDLTFKSCPSFKNIHLKEGDVFPTPYFGDNAGKQVTEEADYLAFPLAFDETTIREIKYAHSYRDQTRPSSKAPRYISRGTKFMGLDVQIVNGKRAIDVQSNNIQAAPMTGVYLMMRK